MLLTNTFEEKMQGINIEACQKKKTIWKGNIEEKDTT